MKTSLLLWIAALSWSSTAALFSQDLDGVLASAKAKAQDGDWADAHQSFLDGIQSEDFKDAVLRRYAEISQNLVEWSFRQEYPQLGPNELLAGQVLSHKEKQRLLRIQYDWSALSDEERKGDFFEYRDEWFFTLPFEDKIKIEMKGNWPEDVERISMVIGYDREDAAGWRFVPGYHRTKSAPTVRMPMQVKRFGKPLENLAQSSDKLEEPEGDWSYAVEFRRGSFTMKRGRKKAGSWKTKYPDKVGGHLGVGGNGIETVTLEGIYSEAALDRALRDKRRVLQESFKRNFDFHPQMPDWFQELSRSAAEDTVNRLPETASRTASSAWEEVRGPFEGAFHFDDWLKEAEMKAPLADYALTVATAREGSWRNCLDAAQKAKAAGMDFGPLLALEARARFLCGNPGQAIEALETALPAWPNDAGFVLADLKGRQYGPEEKAKALDQAIAHGGLAPRIVNLRTQLNRALQGPGQTNNLEHETRIVRILSNGTKESAETLAENVEGLLKTIGSYFLGFRQPREPVTLMHFTTNTSRENFCGRVGLPAHSLGYIPHLRLILHQDENSKRRKDQYRWLNADRSLRRAVCRYFMDSTIDIQAAPRWFVEGNAAFFTWSHLNESEALIWDVNMAACANLKSNEQLFFQPHQLAGLPAWEWEEHGIWLWAEGWLLVQFLRNHEKREWQNRYALYSQGVLEGLDRSALFEKAFGQDLKGRLNRDLENSRREMVDRYEKQLDD